MIDVATLSDLFIENYPLHTMHHMTTNRFAKCYFIWLAAVLDSHKWEGPPDTYITYHIYNVYIDGLVQDCSNSSALAMASLQSCTEPSISRKSTLSTRDMRYAPYNDMKSDQFKTTFHKIDTQATLRYFCTCATNKGKFLYCLVFCAM